MAAHNDPFPSIFVLSMIGFTVIFLVFEVGYVFGEHTMYGHMQEKMKALNATHAKEIETLTKELNEVRKVPEVRYPYTEGESYRKLVASPSTRKKEYVIKKLYSFVNIYSKCFWDVLQAYVEFLDAMIMFVF